MPPHEVDDADGDLFDPARVLKSTRHALRHEQLDLYNRLHSIDEDTRFVRTVAEQYDHLPVVANQRCGAWYVDPKQASTLHAYFKSTDGHTGQWSFSARRANLHLLEVLKSRAGMILVDSTRRGKSFPDALSKTVPLWCSVLNACARSLRRETCALERDPLSTPEEVVGRSEHAQMTACIERIARDFLSTASDNIRAILLELDRPLKPVFICPTTSPRPPLPAPREALAVVCLSASRNDSARERQHGYAYVSGSGDDHESWSLGLTPSLYWSHRLEILSADRASLSSVVERVVASGSTSCDQEPNVLDPPSSRMRLDLGPLASLPETLHGPTLVLAIDESTTPTPSERLHMLDVSPGKRGHSALIAQLDEALRFAGVYFATGETLHIRYLDSELKDAAAALALALLVRFHDANGLYAPPTEPATKASIRSRLHFLSTTSQGRVQPSRSILTRLNGALIPR